LFTITIILSTNNPLVYFWIAEYHGNRALPQFDPSTGHENRFDLVDTPKLARFGWHPFTASFAAKIAETEKVACLPSGLPSHVVDLRKNDKLVAFREVTVKTFKFHVCGKCGGRWQFGVPADKLVGLPTSDKMFVENIPTQDANGKHVVKYVSAVCPSCGYHDCNAVMIKDKLVRCFSSEARNTVYVLGVKGGVIKRINDHGVVM